MKAKPYLKLNQLQLPVQKVIPSKAPRVLLAKETQAQRALVKAIPTAAPRVLA
jgi:hypothetical protein